MTVSVFIGLNGSVRERVALITESYGDFVNDELAQLQCSGRLSRHIAKGRDTGSDDQANLFSFVVIIAIPIITISVFIGYFVYNGSY